MVTTSASRGGVVYPFGASTSVGMAWKAPEVRAILDAEAGGPMSRDDMVDSGSSRRFNWTGRGSSGLNGTVGNTRGAVADVTFFPVLRGIPPGFGRFPAELAFYGDRVLKTRRFEF
jgi:hypothetical protein